MVQGPSAEYGLEVVDSIEKELAAKEPEAYSVSVQEARVNDPPTPSTSAPASTARIRARDFGRAARVARAGRRTLCAPTARRGTLLRIPR